MLFESPPDRLPTFNPPRLLPAEAGFFARGVYPGRAPGFPPLTRGVFALARRSIRTPTRRDKFLRVLAATQVVALAAAAASASVRSFYTWRHDDPAFAADWDAALDGDVDMLEGEAVRRTLEALGRRVLYRGLELARLGENSARPRRPAPAAGNILDYRDEEDLTDEEIDARLAELRRKAGIQEAGGAEDGAPGGALGIPED